jgi:c-di-AMP phosphodiesterase-like protein
MPFTIATNNIKYIGVILTKQVKGLYDKNFKILKREIKEDIRRKIFHIHVSIGLIQKKKSYKKLSRDSKQFP